MNTASLNFKAFLSDRSSFLDHYIDCFGEQSCIFIKMYQLIPSEKENPNWFDYLILAYKDFCECKGLLFEESFLKNFSLRRVHVKNPEQIVISYAVDVEFVFESIQKSNLYLAFDFMCSNWEYDVVVIPLQKKLKEYSWLSLSFEEAEFISNQSGFGVFFSSGHVFDEKYNWVKPDFFYEGSDFFNLYGAKSEINRFLEKGLKESLIGELSNI